MSAMSAHVAPALDWRFYAGSEWIANGRSRFDLYSVSKTDDGGWQLVYVSDCLSGKAERTVMATATMRRQVMHLAAVDAAGGCRCDNCEATR